MLYLSIEDKNKNTINVERSELLALDWEALCYPLTISFKEASLNSVLGDFTRVNDMFELEALDELLYHCCGISEEMEIDLDCLIHRISALDLTLTDFYNAGYDWVCDLHWDNPVEVLKLLDKPLAESFSDYGILYNDLCSLVLKEMADNQDDSIVRVKFSKDGSVVAFISEVY